MSTEPGLNVTAKKQHCSESFIKNWKLSSVSFNIT